MRKLIVSEWVTLDGVFDADSMDVWFNPYHSDERAAHITKTIHGSDALLLGRVTYEMLASYWPHQKNDDMGPASKLNSMPKYIVSSKPLKTEWNNSTIIKGNVVEEITKLKQKPGGDILIPGSATLVRSLMEADLIDEYQFLVHPIVIASGKRFFKDSMPITKLELVKRKSVDLGVVLLCYKPAKRGAFI